MVVFENNIILFSDKHCEFPDSGNLDLDWSRWYRRTIAKSAQQLWGAEQWIRRFPTRVFLDARCTKPIPIQFTVNADTRIHRILVAHGGAERCKRELGGSGSLMINTSVIGDDHLKPRAKAGQLPFEGGCPFMVGRVNPKKGYIHVLDDTTFDILLSTLDTVSDFLAYLRKKEQLIDSLKMLGAAGEEELLAYYLTHMNAAGEYDFTFDQEFQAVNIDEGLWQDFEKSPERRRQIAANRNSYMWDRLIERFLHHFREGTSHHRTEGSLADHERLLRFFAREPRVRRRMLVDSLLEVIPITPSGQRWLRVVKPSRPGDPYVVLLLVPCPPGMTYSKYRTMRANYLQMCCQVVRLDFTDALDIIGFAIETAESAKDGSSEDAIYVDGRDWPPELIEQTRALKKEMNILTSATLREDTVHDYPD
jgi:hypothetical protein